MLSTLEYILKIKSVGLQLLELFDDESLTSILALSRTTNLTAKYFLADYLATSLGYENPTKKGMEFLNYLKIEEHRNALVLSSYR
jgi:hypothetical protein